MLICTGSIYFEPEGAVKCGGEGVGTLLSPPPLPFIHTREIPTLDSEKGHVRLLC